MKDTRELERKLLELAAGIKVTPDNECDELIATVVNAAMAYPFEEAAAALAAQRAEIEAMTVILNLCTEGTDWTYAQVPDELAAQREELERLRKRHEVYAMERAHMRATIDHLIRRLTDIHALIQPEGIKLPDGRVMVFVPPPELLRESWEALSRAIRGIPDSISFALSPLPAAPATEKEKP